MTRALMCPSLLELGFNTNHASVFKRQCRFIKVKFKKKIKKKKKKKKKNNKKLWVDSEGPC